MSHWKLNIVLVCCQYYWTVFLGEMAFSPGTERVHHLHRSQQGIVVLVLLAVLYEAANTVKEQVLDQYGHQHYT